MGRNRKTANRRPAADDLNKVKQARLQTYRRALRENGYWMNYLRLNVLEGLDPHEILNIDKRINGVTADDVKAAARRYLDRKNYVEMVSVSYTHLTLPTKRIV